MNDKKKIKYQHRNAVRQAIEFFGSISELARQLNTTPGHVGNWIYRDHHFPAEYAPTIETITRGHVKKEDLCPTIFQ